MSRAEQTCCGCGALPSSELKSGSWPVLMPHGGFQFSFMRLNYGVTCLWKTGPPPHLGAGQWWWAGRFLAPQFRWDFDLLEYIPWGQAWKHRGLGRSEGWGGGEDAVDCRGK